MVLTPQIPPTTEPSSFPADLQAFVDAQEWTFAKTMPEWPHAYIVRDRVDPERFERLVRHIRAHGYAGAFYRKPITYFDSGGRVYWTMGAPVGETIIVNRCRKEDSYEYRERHGRLPEGRIHVQMNQVVAAVPLPGARD